MKFRYLVILLFIQSNILLGQTAPAPPRGKVYLSTDFGPSISSIIEHFGTYTYKLNGVGLQMDLEAGFALSPNLFLHFSYVSNLLSDPTITVPRIYSPRPSDEIAMKDRLVGGGFTWYPGHQFFISATTGAGSFKLIDRKDPANNEVTDRDISFHFKAGREWLISENWGMGLCLTYGRIRAGNLTDSGIEELRSNRFGLLYSVTMH